jgi:hypothetical protein
MNDRKTDAERALEQHIRDIDNTLRQRNAYTKHHRGLVQERQGLVVLRFDIQRDRLQQIGAPAYQQRQAQREYEKAQEDLDAVRQMHIDAATTETMIQRTIPAAKR